MGFFNKSKEKNRLPDLPAFQEKESNPQSSAKNLSLPDLPPLINSKKNFTLPSFPNSNFGQKMNQNMIKEAITEKEESSLSEKNYNYPNTIQKIKTQEIPDITPIKKISSMQQSIINEKEDSRTLELSDWNRPKSIEPEISPLSQNPQSQKSVSFNIKKSEPLFIKLDKFESTISAFNEIKLKISEIESLLRNIREIKVKEEKELNEWEKEIESIKYRLDLIDKEVFKI